MNKRLFVAILVIALFLLQTDLSPAWQGLTGMIAVTTTDDELNADGDCSLREAVVAANTDAAVDACPAGSGSERTGRCTVGTRRWMGSRATGRCA